MPKRILLKGQYQFSGDPQEVLTYNVDVQPDSLKVTIVGEYKEAVSSVDLASTEQSEPEFVDVTKTFMDIVVPLSSVNSFAAVKPNTLLAITAPIRGEQEILPANIINISALTKSSKVAVPSSPRIPQRELSFVFIFVKDPNGTIEDQDIIISVPTAFTPDTHLISDDTFTVETVQSFNQLELLDTITLSENTGYTNDEYYKFNVASEPYVTDVYLEPLSGITDRTRVTLTNGSGSFRVLKSSVEEGSSIRVRAGFAYYNAIAEINKEV